MSSLWCNVHGHRHPRLDAAIREQLDRVAHVTLLGASNPTTIELARRLVELAPAGLAARLLLRRRGDGGRSRAEDGLSVLAAAARPAAGEDPLSWPWATPITATRSAASASAASTRFHAMFRPLLFEALRRARARHCIAARRASRASNWLAHYLAAAGTSAAPSTTADRRGGDRAAGAGRGGHDHASAGLPARRARADAAVRRAADRRRSGRRLRPHRAHVRLRARSRSRPTCSAWPRGSPAATCRWPPRWPPTRSGRPSWATTPSSRHVLSRPHLRRQPAGRRPWRWPRSTSSTRSRRSRTLQPKIARLSEHLARLAAPAARRRRAAVRLIAGIELVRDRATKEPYPWAERRGHPRLRARP